METEIEILISKKGYRCNKCEHKWIPRLKELPKLCPKCHSPCWDRKKRVKA